MLLAKAYEFKMKRVTALALHVLLCCRLSASRGKLANIRTAI